MPRWIDSRSLTPRRVIAALVDFINPAPVGSAMAKRIVDVLVPVALDQTYSYRVPAGMELAPGDIVRGAARARANAPAWCGPTTRRPIRASTTA